MRRRLEVPDAGDLALHLNRLRDLYRTARESTVLRRINNRKRFVFDKVDSDGSLWAHLISDASERYKIIEEFAFDWHVDGEPPVLVSSGSPMAMSAISGSLFPDAAPILEENLARTDSAICLAGRTAGGSQTQESLSSVMFRQNGETSSLRSLLTIHGWHAGRISRVIFYNARTREFDRAGRWPSIVCADGVASLSRVLVDARFGQSDVIGIVPRTADTDQIEAASQHLASLSQWYTPDANAAVASGDAPVGVTVLVLRKD
jgi:hypothetical protein